MKFLGVPVEIGDRVIARIKTSEKLVSEGWLPTSSGGLQKESAYFKFNKKKREKIGTTINGVIALNPKRNICIKDENDWGFDESMVSSFVIDEKHKMKGFNLELENFRVDTDRQGGLTFSHYDGYSENEDEFYMTEEQTRDLIQKLLKYHGWID